MLRMGLIFLMCISLALAYSHRASGLRSTILKAAPSSAEPAASRSTVLVSYRSGKHDAALEEIASCLKCSVSFLGSVNDLDKATLSATTLNVLDASHITSPEAANRLKQCNSIFLLHDDLEAGRLGDARSACLYDLYSNGNAPGCARRLQALLEKFRSASVPTVSDTLLDAGDWSHFVSLTFGSIEQASEKLPVLRIGADAFELRVDLLDDQSIPSVHRQIALLRDLCPLPIVFTVRSVGQIGKFPAEPERIFALLREGLRAGVEWVDVEACWPQDQTDAFTTLAKSSAYQQTSRLLGSLHVTVPQTKSEIEGLFGACDLRGTADMLKVVTGAASDDDCRRIHEVGSSLPKPYIGVCLGAAGSYSRVLNRRFTPVTHECMAVAAPGQLTVKQLMDRRLQDGLLSPRQHFLFGTPIQQSLSPAMHNAAFRALMLPHVYALDEQTDVDAYRNRLRDSAFGGSSVTIPHKESIMGMLDEVRGAAREIGAVNTVVVEPGGRLVGFNTDWLGIKRPVLAKLRARAQPWAGGVGLVVGAGGTARAACYAVQSLGLKLYVTNRSPDKGRELAKLFGGTFVDMEDLATAGVGDLPLKAVISTVPNAAGFTLPPTLLQQTPVVLDVVYKPARTELLKQAQAAGCPVVQGATMLLTQGLEQFELWNKRRAPFTEMEAAIFAGVERID